VEFSPTLGQTYSPITCTFFLKEFLAHALRFPYDKSVKMFAHDKIRSRFIAALPDFESVRKSPSKLAYPTPWPAIQVSAETPKSSAQIISLRQQKKIAPIRNVRASRCLAFARHLRFIFLDERGADASGPSKVRVPITPLPLFCMRAQSNGTSEIFRASGPFLIVTPSRLKTRITLAPSTNSRLLIVT
jgi:hypothetical protein